MTTLTAERTVIAGLIERELDGISDGMAALLQRLGASPALTRTGDLAAGILSGSGELLAGRLGNDAHRFPLRQAAAAILQAFQGDLAPGDAIIVNDPYSGGSALCCMTLLVPLLTEGQLDLAVAVRVRHADVGGPGAGGFYPQATELAQEGDRIPPLRLVRQGRLLQDRWTRLLKNNRLPQLYDLDLSAMLQAARWGAAQLSSLVQRYGRETLATAADDLLGQGERAFRALIANWPAGVYQGQARWSSEEALELTVEVSLEIKPDGLTFDFSGSPAQIRAPFNSPLANTWSQALLPLQPYLWPPTWRNDGFLRAVELIALEATITNATYPAPTGLCEFHPGLEIEAAVSEALAQALGRSLAEAAPSPWGLIGPHRVEGRVFSGRTPVTRTPYRTPYNGHSWLRLSDWVGGGPGTEEVELIYTFGKDRLK